MSTGFEIYGIYLSESQLEDTRKFLKNREEDIALGVEDFGNLKGLFKVLFYREPQSNPKRDTKK